MVGLDRIKKDIDSEKNISRKNKVESKSTTFEQRRARYMPFVFTTLTLMGAKAIEAVGVESSNQVKEVADRIRHSTYNSRAEGYIPSPQQMEQAKRWYEERGLPFDPPPDDVQGTLSEGQGNRI